MEELCRSADLFERMLHDSIDWYVANGLWEKARIMQDIRDVEWHNIKEAMGRTR